MKRCIYARCGRTIQDDSAFCPYCGRKQERETRKKRRRKSGSGSVYKLASGQRRKPWIATKNGHSIGGYFATEREALDALERLAEVEDMELFNVTTAQAYDRWSATAYADCKPSFRNDYGSAWKHFSDQVKGSRFREVKADAMQQEIDRAFAEGLSESGQLKMKSLFAFLCAWASSNDIISKDYSRFVKTHKTERRKDDSVFSFAEVEKIIAKATGDLNERTTQTAMMVVIYLFTGMRLNELLTVKVADVHLEDEFPYLIGGEKTEAGRNRIVPLTETVRPCIAWFISRSTGELLFSGYMGNKAPKHWRERDYKPLLASLGIPYHTPHGTRRTATTNAVEAQVAPAAWQKIGGWEEFQTIQKHYNKPNVEYLYHEAEKVEKARKAKLKAQGL